MFFAVKLCQKGGGVGKRDARALACGCSVIVHCFAGNPISVAWPQESGLCSTKVAVQMVMLCRIEAAPSQSRIVVEAATLMSARLNSGS